MAKPKSLNRIFKISRWLHVYCSAFLFALLVFFCITGIFLNHRWYNQTANTEHYEEMAISEQQISNWSTEQHGSWQPNLTSLIVDIESEFGLSSPNSIDIDDELREIILEYKVPAGFASVIIEMESSLLILETESGSMVGLMNDLHKGRDSGAVWFWLIDASAALMTLFSLTGIIILFQGKKYRKQGLISALAGAITPILIYLFFVPSVWS